MVCRMVLLVCVSALLLSVAGEGVAGDVGGVGGEGPAAARRISPQQDKKLGESPTSRNAVSCMPGQLCSNLILQLFYTAKVALCPSLSRALSVAPCDLLLFVSQYYRSIASI